jgi:hypothetical protein
MALIEQLLHADATEGTIAKMLGITKVTFIANKKDPENAHIVEMIAMARDDVQSRVQGYLMDVINDPSRTGHLSAVMFWLKTRCHYRETDPAVQVFTGALDPAQLDARLKELIAKHSPSPAELVPEAPEPDRGT